MPGRPAVPARGRGTRPPGGWRGPVAGAPDVAYAAVDSWLVDAGRVRGLEGHRARFTAAACGPAAAPDPADVQRFLDAAVGALPRTGRWFPRVELAHGLDAPLGSCA